MKTIYIGAIVVGVLAILGAGLVFAQGGMSSHHDDMKKIMDGTYKDLVEYRKESGINIMSMVDSEEKFNQVQEMHKEMMSGDNNEKMADMMKKMHGEENDKGEMGCPMMD